MSHSGRLVLFWRAAVAESECDVVVDGEHGVFAVRGEDGGERAQPCGSGQLAGLVGQRDPLVVLEDEEDGAVGADLLGVGGGQAVEGVRCVGAEGAEASGEVCFSILEASEVGGEPGEVCGPAAR
jgi:hypothetical protein